ncbi:MAG: 23S rRNA (guanosine(2251)-2'-O)-methyltransferase RlmB [Clostridiales bacterium]|nr:23S rRNA (guanosine(2251)-2'-O)-methyltransferase RlmB [Clostridiales bacterium]
MEDIKSSFIEGKHAVLEALRAGRVIDKIYFQKELSDAQLSRIRSEAKKKGVLCVECDKRKLDTMSETKVHQGIIASAAQTSYSSLDDIFRAASEREEKPFIVICDGIEDPHNLGAIIRSAAASGVHGVIISKHYSVGLNATVAKAAAGALEHMLIVKVANLTNAIKELQNRGVWVFASAADGDRTMYEADLKGSCAIVIGSEGSGISRLVRQTCDFTVRIPIRTETESLNASVAAAVLMFEAVRQRQ